MSSTFTNILRAGRREAGELPFRQLAKKISKKQSLATVTRTFKSDRETLPKWQVVEDVLVHGLEVGPKTVSAMREAWAGAQNVIRPIDTCGAVSDATMSTPAITSSIECDICGLEVRNRKKHIQFHAEYVRRTPSRLTVAS